MISKFTLFCILAILFSVLTGGTTAATLDNTVVQAESRFSRPRGRACYIRKWCVRVRRRCRRFFGPCRYRYRCKLRIACPTPSSSPISTVSATPSMSPSTSVSPSPSASITPSASPSVSMTPSASPSPSTSPGFVVSSGVLNAANSPNTVFLDNTDAAVGDKVTLTNFKVTGGTAFQLPGTVLPIAAVSVGSDLLTACTSTLLPSFPSTSIMVPAEVVSVDGRIAVQLAVTTSKIQPEPTPMPLATPCPVIDYSFDVVPL